jgi:hypothetical protein
MRRFRCRPRQVGVNTPSRRKIPLGVRGPHHDRIVEVWAGLLYMRDDKDRSTGAALSSTSSYQPLSAY